VKEQPMTDLDASASNSGSASVTETEIAGDPVPVLAPLAGDPAMLGLPTFIVGSVALGLVLVGVVPATAVGASLPIILAATSAGLFIATIWSAAIGQSAVASIFGIFLVRQYALSIPDEMLDAARVDGASEFRIFWSIVVPGIAPILATLSIWTFLATWNDFMWPLIVLSDEAHYTLPVALANLSGEHVMDTELMMAGSVLTVIPVLAVFLFLQRYYIQGVMAGSVKG